MIYETDRLIVRSLTAADDVACFEIYGDPEVTRYITSDGSAAPNIELIRVQLSRGLLAPRDDPRFGFFAVERREDARVIGTTAIVPMDNGEHEIGWHFARAAWGKGYASESGIGLLRYGFDRLGLPRLWALAYPENQRSTAVARRIGMEPRGIRDHEGRPHESFVAERMTWAAPRESTLGDLSARIHRMRDDPEHKAR